MWAGYWISQRRNEARNETDHLAIEMVRCLAASIGPRLPWDTLSKMPLQGVHTM